jgi:hypothetical protein
VKGFNGEETAMATTLTADKDVFQFFNFEDYIEYRRARKLGTNVAPTNSYARYLRLKVKGLQDAEIEKN